MSAVVVRRFVGVLGEKESFAIDETHLIASMIVNFMPVCMR